MSAVAKPIPGSHAPETRSWRRHLPAMLLLAAIVGSIAFASGGFADDTIPADPGYLVTATSPVTNVTDGQPVTINVKSLSTTPIYRVQINQCVADATYTKPSDLAAAAGKCGTKGVSTSGDDTVARESNITAAVETPTGASLNFRVGVGTAKVDPSNPASGTIICDSTHQCVLVVGLSLANTTFAYVKVPLAISDATPLSSCGGAAPGVIRSSASDQLQDAWAEWTRGSCQVPGSTGASTSIVFQGEGLAVNAFAQGNVDLAYTASGYNPAVGFGPANASKQRPAVAVPIALDAAVVAAGGGENRTAPFWDKPKYAEVKLRANDSAALFSGVITSGDSPRAIEIFADNPHFESHLFQNSPTVSPQVAAEGESSSWILTNYFKTRAPADWIDRDKNPRDPTASFGTATPPFPALVTYSGRTTLQKVIDLAAQNYSANGPIWVATDLATAESLNLTPVSITNANGDFVTPTPDSLAAAVATMKPDANGFLVPDPNAVAASPTAVQPYPLTYVVYAMVPTEALIDPTTCGPNTVSQNVLTRWLTYLTGDGQKSLPAGLQPLTPELENVAAAAIPKVGASKSTATCVPTTTPTTTAPATATTASGGGGGGGGSNTSQSLGVSPNRATSPSNSRSSGSRSSFSANLANVPAVGSSNPAAAAPGATKPNETVLAAVPAFAGHKLADTTDGMLALIGIVVVTSLAAWVTAGPSAGAVNLAGAGTASVAGPDPGPGTGALVALWLGVAVASFGLVVYQLGPVLQQRDQRSLLSQYRTDVRHAAAESGTLEGVKVATKPPEPGSAVGVLEIGALETQKVVVEGVSPSDTVKGTGHVPGTAGLGQPGNSVVVARRNAFGGSFGDLASLRKGQKIVVTTTQGQSVYSVRTVETRTIRVASGTDSTGIGGTGTGTARAPATTASGGSTTTTANPGASAPDATTAPTPTTAAPGAADSGTATTAAGGATSTTAAKSSKTSEVKSGGPITTDALYGPSKDNRLTLVTSASKAPWNSRGATVVVARMIGKPFAPTPQGARSDKATGRGGDSGVWSTVVLVLAAYAAAVIASVLLYRRMRFRVAYILTIAPLVALTVIAAGTLSRLLPAWT